MKKEFRNLTSVMCMCAAVALTSCSKADDEGVQEMILLVQKAVTVTNYDGDPLSGATVTALDGTGATTNSEGLAILQLKQGLELLKVELSGYAGYNSSNSSITLPKMGAKLTGKVALYADGSSTPLTVGTGTTAQLKLSTVYTKRKYETPVGNDGVFLFNDLPERISYYDATLSFVRSSVTYNASSSYFSTGKSGTTSGSTTSTIDAREVVE